MTNAQGAVHLKLEIFAASGELRERRRLSVASAGYSALEAAVGRFVRGPWTAAYRDDDGDEVTVCGEAEWAECLAVVAGMGAECVRVRVRVAEENESDAAAPAAAPVAAEAAGTADANTFACGRRGHVQRKWAARLRAARAARMMAAQHQHAGVKQLTGETGCLHKCDGDVGAVTERLVAGAPRNEGGEWRQWGGRARHMATADMDAALAPYADVLKQLTEEMGYPLNHNLKRVVVRCGGDVSAVTERLARRAAQSEGVSRAQDRWQQVARAVRRGGWHSERMAPAADIDAAVAPHADALKQLTEEMGYPLDHTLKRVVVRCGGDVSAVTERLARRAARQARNEDRHAGGRWQRRWRQGGRAANARPTHGADVDAALAPYADALKQLTEEMGYPLDHTLKRVVVRCGGDVSAVTERLARRAMWSEAAQARGMRRRGGRRCPRSVDAAGGTRGGQGCRTGAVRRCR